MPYHDKELIRLTTAIFRAKGKGDKTRFDELWAERVERTNSNKRHKQSKVQQTEANPDSVAQQTPNQVQVPAPSVPVPSLPDDLFISHEGCNFLQNVMPIDVFRAKLGLSPVNRGIRIAYGATPSDVRNIISEMKDSEKTATEVLQKARRLFS